MKKLSIIIAAALGLLAAASCQKEQNVVSVTKGNSFEIIANLPKTSLDGYNVSWVDGDKISVCMDGTGATEWKTGKEFTYDAASGKFTTTSGLTIKDTTCFFNVLYGDNTQYSYHKNTQTTFKLTDAQTQDCANPTAQLANLDALAGWFEFTAPAEGGQITSAVTLDMHHVFTLMEIDLVNDSGAEITASSLTLAAANDIAGVCKIDYLAEPNPAVSEITSSAKKAIKVNITGGVIPDKGTLPVYLVMVPLAEYTGDITLTVNDAVNGNVYEKTVSLTNANFKAGELNKTNYTLKTGTTIEYKTIAEARAAESEFSANLNIKNLQVMATGASDYFVKDATGSIYVFAAPGTLVPGEKITITGATTSTYKEFRQIKSPNVSSDGVDTPSYPEPTVLDATSFDALGTSLGEGSGVGEYCKFSGTLTISGSGSKIYYNIAVPGATKVGAIVKPNADLLPLAVSGSNVEITGYSLYLSGNFVYFIATDIKGGCAVPSFSPSAGAVAAGTEVTISCATAGATIYYTTDGTEPTVASTKYTSAITINEATTIKAIAVKEGYFDSPVATAEYTIGSATSITLDFTTKKYGNNNYTSTWTWGESTATDVWKIKYGANNAKGWTYVKMGGKKDYIGTYNPCEIWYTGKVTTEAKKVSVNITSGSFSKSGMSVNSWGVYVYSDADMTNQIDYVAGGTITNAAALFEFKPSAGKTWKDCYFKVSWDLANTSTGNGIICLDNVTISF